MIFVIKISCLILNFEGTKYSIHELGERNLDIIIQIFYVVLKILIKV